jgi:general secretion pathway protein N
VIRRAHLITVGVLVMLAALIALFPARVAGNWLAPASVSLGGISGTLWNGQSREMQVGDIMLRDVRWRLLPLSFFRGEIGFSVSSTPPGGFMEGDVAFGLGGTIHLSDIRALLSLQSLQSSFRLPGLRGTANLQLDHLLLTNGRPEAAAGVLGVSGLILPPVASTPIGGYRAEFSGQGFEITASVEDTDGVVDLAGLFSLSPEWNYLFTGLVAAKPATPNALRTQMTYLGPANERSQYEFRLEGRL